MANEVGFIDVEGCLWDESKDDEMDPLHVGQPPGSASKKYQYASTGTEGKKSGSSGELFQVTRERVRQIESKAVRKLQHPVRSRQLQGFLEGITAIAAGH